MPPQQQQRSRARALTAVATTTARLANATRSGGGRIRDGAQGHVGGRGHEEGAQAPALRMGVGALTRLLHAQSLPTLAAGDARAGAEAECTAWCCWPGA